MVKIEWELSKGVEISRWLRSLGHKLGKDYFWVEKPGDSFEFHARPGHEEIEALVVLKYV